MEEFFKKKYGHRWREIVIGDNLYVEKFPQLLDVKKEKKEDNR